MADRESSGEVVRSLIALLTCLELDDTEGSDEAYGLAEELLEQHSAKDLLINLAALTLGIMYDDENGLTPLDILRTLGSAVGQLTIGE